MAPILVGLIAVACASSADTRCAQQRKADRVVARLVRGVLRVGENGDAVAAALVGQVDPPV